LISIWIIAQLSYLAFLIHVELVMEMRRAIQIETGQQTSGKLLRAEWHIPERRSYLDHVVTDDGPKFPNPWLVRRIAELQIEKMPRALWSFTFSVKLS